MYKVLKTYLIVTCIIIIVFVGISLLDVFISVIYARFYTTAALVTTFGVGGIFAAVFGFQYGAEANTAKDEKTRWSLILFMLVAGLLFFFLLASMEGGEYEAAFKGFGITLSLGGFLFSRGKF